MRKGLVLGGGLAYLALVLAHGLFAGDSPEIRTAELEAQLRFLASDELEGRLTGTSGNDVAARFIAEQFRASSVSTPHGWDDYLQPVPLVRVHPPELQALTLDGRKLEAGKDFLLLSGGSTEYAGKAATAGFGVVNEERNDYKGFAAGSAALLRFGLPGNPQVTPRTVRAKGAAAAANGATAVLEFFPGDNWDQLVGYLARPRMRVDNGDGEEQGIPHFLLRESGTLRYSDFEGKAPVDISVSIGEEIHESVHSSNVIGLIDGSDPLLRSQYVILSAHYDHVGSGMQIRGATKEDHIFNGARDNGMGVVALLTAARRLAQNPPARSVILLAVTAEEEGLLGSSYYVEHPVIPLEKTVFDLNSDGAGYTDTSVVTVLGLARSSAKMDIVAGSATAGLEAIGGPAETASFFDRSDNVNFARKGVPSVTYSPGFRKLDQELMKRYHQPNDEVDSSFDFGYLRRYCLGFADSAERIADNPEAPKWTLGDRYESAGKELYRPK